MKIAYISSEMYPVPPIRGGAVETWTYEVAKRIPGQVYSFCFYEPGLAGYKDDEGFQLKAYRKGILGKLLLSTYKLPFKNDASYLYYLPYSFWCGWQIRKLKIDIIHVLARPQFIPVLRFLNPQAKIILHIQNVSTIEPHGKLWGRSLFEQTDLIITCSDYLKEEVLTRYPFVKNKIATVYNGVDAAKFNPERFTAQASPGGLKLSKNGDLKILYSGRLVEYKGVHLLIEAFEQLVKEYPQLTLTIVGCWAFSSNEETPYIKKLKASAMGLKERVQFTGYVDHQDIPRHLQAADIVVVPSVWEEPFGMIVVEAMAVERPVIAFGKGGIKEIISNNVDGILVKDSSSSGLTEAIRALIQNPPERARLGVQARKTVQKKFDWPWIVQETQKQYEGLCKPNA